MNDDFNAWKEYWDQLKLEADDLYKRSTSLDQQEHDLISKETASDTLLGLLPGVGQAMAARDFERARRGDDWAGMGLAAVSALPLGKLLTKGGGGIKQQLIGGSRGLKDDAAKAAMEEAYKNPSAFKPGSSRSKETGVVWDEKLQQPVNIVPDVAASLDHAALKQGGTVPLRQVLKHPEWEKAYGTELMDNLLVRHMSVEDLIQQAMKKGNLSRAQAIASVKKNPLGQILGRFTETGGRPTLHINPYMKDAEQLNTVLHELQHGVQSSEKWMPKQIANSSHVKSVIEKNNAAMLSKEASMEAKAGWQKAKQEWIDLMPNEEMREKVRKGLEKGATDAEKDSASNLIYQLLHSERQPRWIENMKRNNQAAYDTGQRTSKEVRDMMSERYENINKISTGLPTSLDIEEYADVFKGDLDFTKW